MVRTQDVGGVLGGLEWRFQRESGVLIFVTPLVKALCHKG